MTAIPPYAVVTAYSDARDEQQAARSLAERLRHPNLGFVLFFCSIDYDLDRLAGALSEDFQGVPLCGCTSAGEITARGYDRDTVVAIGFDRRFFAVSHRLIERLDGFTLADAQQLTDGLLGDCRDGPGGPVSADNSFVLTLLDGLSVNEELVLATLNAALGSITSFGGSAGDDYRLSRTYVYSDGAFHSDAAIVLMVTTSLDFEVFSIHHLRPDTRKLVVTAADAERRVVQELNAAPAAEEYARLVGVPVAELNDEVFARYPLAVRINSDYYARSIQRVNDDLSLSFYCAVENGIVLTAMRTGSLIGETRDTLNAIEARLGPAWVTIGCDCCLRRMEMESGGFAEPASALLREHKVVGFNTYGEQFNGMHINQTLTGVVIGRRHRAPGP
ncbi:nitric oxide-sensing protein NosP [Alloalcanivorax marinus]|uniref:nitric oxide-sensing protein NosP n=1 Tax=Alloalcanivorax marinus TaxID=1177169 RepID=UPI0019337A7F|nr:nitric oxide-sensing protein NosP [Alloalcanivorax marinus]MBL7249331.1 FIST C-terminal domain-containing protein [Alloalcanivorax marinus]